MSYELWVMGYGLWVKRYARWIVRRIQTVYQMRLPSCQGRDYVKTGVWSTNRLCTNHPDSLDLAIWTSNRFDTHLPE